MLVVLMCALVRFIHCSFYFWSLDLGLNVVPDAPPNSPVLAVDLPATVLQPMRDESQHGVQWGVGGFDESQHGVQWGVGGFDESQHGVQWGVGGFDESQHGMQWGVGRFDESQH